MTKTPFLLVLSILGIFFSNNEPASPLNTSTNTMANTKIRITVNSKVFTASLEDSKTAAAFAAFLPLKLEMNELNANEKYADLPKSLPTASYSPGTIQNGDLMLYGDNTLVLFYKTFSTPYRYTRLGSVADVKGLAAALGSGNPTVHFEKE